MAIFRNSPQFVPAHLRYHIDYFFDLYGAKKNESRRNRVIFA